MEFSVKVVVATHKKYQMPDNELYLPLHVGAEGKFDDQGNPLDLGYLKDNTGDNISEFNSSFCELTGLYWAWKNLNSDYIGLVHYRRHFSMKKKPGVENILTLSELNPYLEQLRYLFQTKEGIILKHCIVIMSIHTMLFNWMKQEKLLWKNIQSI